MSSTFQLGPRRVLFVDDDRSIQSLFHLVLNSGKEATTQRTRRFLDAHLSPPDGTSPPQARPSETPSGDGALAFVDVRGAGIGVPNLIERIWRAAPELRVIICSAPKASWRTISEPTVRDDGLRVLEQPFERLEVLVDRQTRAEMAELKQLLVRRTTELEETQRRLDGEQQERERMEAELRLAQKLESVGQLAAGVAHEINSPMQYIGDSVHFLQRAFGDLLAASVASRECVAALAERGSRPDLIAAARKADESLDIDYLREQIPRALERTLEGIDRVSSIVQAMRDFAHPDMKEKAPADLNRALQSTLTVCRNEYKYVADVDVEWGDLPLVECHLGEINQAFLNLIVNAAHAIADARVGVEGKGKILIRTRSEAGFVFVSIEDDGTGIPENIRNRVFDPFFTTKPVGRGTGQGLAIARSIVVDKHGGRLTFESRAGRGTRFDVELPIVARTGPAGRPPRRVTGPHLPVTERAKRRGSP
jgi:signal transduction histidine kinase